MYLDDLFINIKELPKLDKEEINYLLKNKDSSNDAREKLIIYNVKLVIYEVLTKFNYINYDKKELVSIGIVGLIKAVGTYDINKGFLFSTYAMKCIDNEIFLFLNKLKKYQNECNIDLIKELNSSYNIEDNYCTKEYYEIVRNLVQELPNKEKEIIMLYYGFYNDKLYTQKDIAKIFNVSQENISKIIIRVLKKLHYRLEEINNEEYLLKKKK